jgi:hypothetical protein
MRMEEDVAKIGMDVGGSPSSVMEKVSIGTRISVPGPHDSIKKLRALYKKVFFMNENIKMNKVYQSLPFLRSTLKCS